MSEMANVVQTPALQALAACGPPPLIIGWIFLGTALVAGLLQFLFRRRLDPLWHLIAAIQPAILLILGLLSLLGVRWYCWVADGSFIFLRIVALLLAIAGLSMLVAGALQLWRGSQSRNWPGTVGRILTAGVKTHRTTKGTWYEPKLAYEYLVNGIPHSGTRLRFGQSRFRYEDEARQVVNTYPAGEEVQVRYAPNRPKVSVLEPGVQNRFMMVAVTMGGAIVAGIGLLLLLAEIEPSRRTSGGRYRSVTENGPYGYIAFAFLLLSLGGTYWWTHTKKGEFNPWVPTAVVALIIPVWFGIMQFGSGRSISPAGVPFLLGGWLLLTLVIHVSFRSMLRTRRGMGDSGN